MADPRALSPGPHARLAKPWLRRGPISETERLARAAGSTCRGGIQRWRPRMGIIHDTAYTWRMARIPQVAIEVQEAPFARVPLLLPQPPTIRNPASRWLSEPPQSRFGRRRLSLNCYCRACAPEKPRFQASGCYGDDGFKGHGGKLAEPEIARRNWIPNGGFADTAEDSPWPAQRGRIAVAKPDTHRRPTGTPLTSQRHVDKQTTPAVESH